MTVAIPDYTVTPAGSDYGDPRQQHDAIVAANATMARLATERGIAFVDTFDLSLRAADDRVARRGRRAPPERRPVRPLGGADRARRPGAHRALIAQVDWVDTVATAPLTGSFTLLMKESNRSRSAFVVFSRVMYSK